MCLIIFFVFVSLSVMASVFCFLRVVEGYFAQLIGGVEYVRHFFHVFHRQAGER